MACNEEQRLIREVSRGSDDQQKAGRRMRFALIATLLTAALTFLMVQYQRRPDGPTQDELFNRFYGLLSKEFDRIAKEESARSLKKKLNLPITAPLNDIEDLSALRGWEAEFGRDPHYWELRGLCLHDSDALLQKLEAGLFSPGMLFVCGVWSVYDHDPALALKLTDRAITADPQGSFWHYRKADLLLEGGRQAEALAELKLGNAAMENRLPMPYPTNYLRQPEIPRSARDKTVWGYLAVRWPGDLMEHNRQKEILKTCLSDSNSSPVLLDALYRKHIRQAMMHNNGMLDLIASVACQIRFIDRADPEALALNLDPQQKAEAETYLNHSRGMGQLCKNFLLESDRKYKVGVNQTSAEYLRQRWEKYVSEAQDLQDLRAEFSGLLPPPMVAWSKGELAGIQPDAKLQAAAEEWKKARAQREARKAEEEREKLAHQN